MCEAHFTLRSNISLPKAISLVPKERISLKKPLAKASGFFMAPLVGLEPTTCGLTEHETAYERAKQPIKKQG